MVETDGARFLFLWHRSLRSPAPDTSYGDVTGTDQCLEFRVNAAGGAEGGRGGAGLELDVTSKTLGVVSALYWEPLSVTIRWLPAIDDRAEPVFNRSDHEVAHVLSLDAPAVGAVGR